MRFRSLLWLALLATAIPAAAQETGTLKKLHDTGEIVLGARDASIPFSYADDTGQSIGYSVDLCMRVVDHLRQTLKMPGLKVRQQLVTSANRVPLVLNGTVDLECGSTVNNLERQKTVAFSLTTFIVNTKFIVKASSGVQKMSDLKGKTVAKVSARPRFAANRRAAGPLHLARGTPEATLEADPKPRRQVSGTPGLRTVSTFRGLKCYPVVTI